jgi:DNA-binding transcriptional MerR regulator
MDLFYGTYLTYLIKQQIQTSKSGLTVKEIEEALHRYPTNRERVNFRNRIRQCLKSLYEHEIVLREEVQNDTNLIFHKYKLNHAQKTQKQ